MKTIICGEIFPYNVYHLENIQKDYNQVFIKHLKSFREVAEFMNLPPAIMGKSILGIFETEGFIGYINSVLSKVENIPDKPYLHLVVRFKIKGQKADLLTTLNLIDLDKIRNKDFCKYISESTNLPPHLSQIVVNRIGLNLPVFSIYQQELQEISRQIISRKFNSETESESEKILFKKLLKENVPYKKSISLHKVLYGILLRNKSAYRELDRSPYAKTWLDDFFKKELKRIIDLKIKYKNGELSMQKITSSDKLKKYGAFVKDIPMADVELLKLLLSRYKHSGIDLYFAISMKDYLSSTLMDIDNDIEF